MENMTAEPPTQNAGRMESQPPIMREQPNPNEMQWDYNWITTDSVVERLQFGCGAVMDGGAVQCSRWLQRGGCRPGWNPGETGGGVAGAAPR